MPRRGLVVVAAMAAGAIVYAMAWTILGPGGEDAGQDATVLWWPGMAGVLAIVWIPLVGFVAWLLVPAQRTP